MSSEDGRHSRPCEGAPILPRLERPRKAPDAAAQADAGAGDEADAPAVEGPELAVALEIRVRGDRGGDATPRPRERRAAVAGEQDRQRRLEHLAKELVRRAQPREVLRVQHLPG